MLTYRRNIKRMICIKSTLNNASPEIMDRKKQYVQISFYYRQNVNKDTLPPIKLHIKASPEIMDRKNSMYRYPIYTAKMSIMIRCRQ